ncbi:hypothetical protein AC1031_011020 [Aphanomyces cochlioides]|nr:hypothetical protein AC1031_011020 [Aphanomyces cochlioides]
MQEGESVCRNFIKRVITGAFLASGIVAIFTLCPRIATSALMSVLLAVCMWEFSWLMARIKPHLIDGPPLDLEQYALASLAARWQLSSRSIVVALFALTMTMVVVAFFIGFYYLVGKDALSFDEDTLYSSFVPYIAVSASAGAVCAGLSPTKVDAANIALGQVSFLVIILDTVLCPYEDTHCTYVIDSAFVLTCECILMGILHLSTAPTMKEAYIRLLLDQMGIVYLVGLVQIVSNFVDLSAVSEGRKVVLVLLFAVWAADSGSYFTGHFLRWVGYTRYHKLAPHLSPNKDVEGTLGGVVFALAVTFIVTYVLNMTTAAVTKALLTIVAILFSRCGDLFESLLKRAADVKDSSQLLPGHGGLLDRVDALLFACVVFAVYNIHIQLI